MGATQLICPWTYLVKSISDKKLDSLGISNMPSPFILRAFQILDLLDTGVQNSRLYKNAL